MSYTEGSETGGTDHWPGYAKEEKGTSSSITVEPVPSEQEKQEELWEEVLKYCEEHYIGDIRVREHLERTYRITRN